ncbi:hypothetical protein BKM63_18605 [Flavobacterium johnsoniae]|uniref:Uncharacterized protein n=1 Tax=Flavobacterium johnsoniae TaxID=986 RepID=A0A1J7CH49_FLAJO|nr:hypothetical protein BKM63_18605 [Flavobacterium johnsoniae]
MAEEFYLVWLKFYTWQICFFKDIKKEKGIQYNTQKLTPDTFRLSGDGKFCNKKTSASSTLV